MKAQTRKALPIRPSRWIAYATASLATASGGAVSAEAAIHYSGVIDRKLHSGDTLLPLSGGASLLFQRFGGYADTMWVIPTDHEGVATNFSGSFGYLLKLRGRINASTAGIFNAAGALIDYSSQGNFVSPGEGFAAFMFDIGKGSQYGWVRIRTLGGRKHPIEVIDYAWADPGEPISTGQKKERSEANEKVTQSGSLGLLALGSLGLAAWRQRRK